MSNPTQTPTPSLRRRVTLTVLGLFALLLILVGVAVDITLGGQLRRDLDIRLADLADRASVLAAEGASPQQIIQTLDGAGIRVRVITADGDVFGDPGLVTPPDRPGGCRPRPPPPGCPPQPPGCPLPPPGAGPPPPGCPPPPPRADDSAPTTVVSRKLPGGSTVSLLADSAQIAEVQRDLRAVMLVAAGLTLAVAAVALHGSVGRALRPLDTMTALARQITAGDRGRRLRPDRRGSELGRAASAFDGMLDALETAEAGARAAAETARRAEADTRQFLADAAHELRTPIAGIANIAETLARDRGNETGQRDRFTELLMREAGQASRLVSDMLEAARIDADLPLDLQPVDLVKIVDDEIVRARLLAPRLTLERDGAATALGLLDPGRVSQIVANLLNNARRHTPPGGLITVTVAVIGGLAEVIVTDTGPGIADADRERIFVRMVRLQDARDRDSGGSGLGLTIARGLARAHRGDLTCERHTGGARFRLTLPLAHPVLKPT